MEIDIAASEAAFAPLAERFSMTLEKIADAAIRVADANIVRAMQIVSTERGKDPRDYALVAFGGAGPLHACRVAEDLRVKTVVVPLSLTVPPVMISSVSALTRSTVPVKTTLPTLAVPTTILLLVVTRSSSVSVSTN